MPMATKTAIEKDPVNKVRFGWGEDDRDTPAQRYFKEQLAAEESENEGCYSELKVLIKEKQEKYACLVRNGVLSAENIRDGESPMEKLVKENMPYDDGWDHDFVDNMFYKSEVNVDQNGVGSCVGAGAMAAVGTKASSEILILNDAENPFGMTIQQYQSGVDCSAPNVDYSYGCGKMKRYWMPDEQKFSRSVRMGDGSWCSVQIWAMQTTGVLPCRYVKNADRHVFPQTKNIRSHAGNGSNFLNDHIEIGMKYRMKNSVRVESADDLIEVVTKLKHTCMICSNWGFGPSHQVEGLGWVYRKSGSWAHNMTIVAVVEFKGKWYVKVRNQWGSNAHRDGWYFFIPIEVFASWIRGAECQSIGDLNLEKSESITAEFPF